jgi:hypothetical protein
MFSAASTSFCETDILLEVGFIHESDHLVGEKFCQLEQHFYNKRGICALEDDMRLGDDETADLELDLVVEEGLHALEELR